jgi:hypothetical protein
MIEGFLAGVGFSCAVETSIGEKLPACAFQVAVKEAKSSVLDPRRLLSAIAAPETATI